MNIKLVKALLVMAIALVAFAASPRAAHAQRTMSLNACFCNNEFAKDWIIRWNLPCNGQYSLTNPYLVYKTMLNCGLKTYENVNGQPVLQLTVGYRCRVALPIPFYFPGYCDPCAMANSTTATITCF